MDFAVKKLGQGEQHAIGNASDAARYLLGDEFYICQRMFIGHGFSIRSRVLSRLANRSYSTTFAAAARFIQWPGVAT